jgi:methionyl-tRNA formyltransferase
MRLVFAGTPAFARVALEALLDAGHDVVLVLTQPDRPAGRGLKLRHSEVKALALQRELPLQQPASLNSAAALPPLLAVGAQALVVAAYGLILPQPVLDLFALGCINIHASLLPRWRGAAPIQRAILAGDSSTGISIMRMEAGLDTGAVYLSEVIPIAERDTALSLHDKLAVLGARCILRALPGIESGALAPQAQPEAGVSYAHKIGKDEAELEWSRSAVELDRQVRAFDPFPVATTHRGAELLRVWAAQPLAGPAGVPGEVLQVGEAGIVVGCGSGALRLEELQRPGGRRLPARELLRGVSIALGDRLGATASSS